MKDIDYWNLRSVVSKLVPREIHLSKPESYIRSIKEKGRKSNYYQFNLVDKSFEKKERLLNTEEMNSFLEISIRSQACPMSLNMDVVDGLLCPHGCKYCFADSFRASLYTSFFDNSKDMGLRWCSPSYFLPELEKLLKFRGKPGDNLVDTQKAISLEMPVRLGIRFENFIPAEREKKVAYRVLEFLRDQAYPVMINTKGAIVGEDPYVKVLADNKGKSAVHITMISSDPVFTKTIEPGAPSFKDRVKAAKNLTSSGVRVVARIEPFMVFLNDSKDMVDDYVGQIKEAGIANITFDTYSYSANNPGIKSNFVNLGYDYSRMFTLMSECQWLGSYLLGAFMSNLRKEGFKCSTFDFGNVPDNDNDICCEVGDWFKGFCYGNSLSAVRYIASRKTPTRWMDFEKFVEGKGGFLSPSLKTDVKRLWNLAGNDAYSIGWAAGLEPLSSDKDGLIWNYNPNYDFREEMLNNIIG